MRRFLVLALSLALFEGPAQGDGAFFPTRELGQSGQVVASPKQEAILLFDGETVQVVLRTHFRAGPQELAWIVPVPAPPTDVASLGDELFEQLHQATAPRFYKTERGRKLPFTCAAGRGQAPAGEGVTVEAAGTAGVFEWTALGTADTAALIAWLDQNGYAVPERAAAVFDLYVKNRWHWLAIKVRPDAAAQQTLAPHPITYTYRGDKLFYPLVISQLSADAENEIVLYVLAKDPYAPANWPHRRISQFTVRPDPKAPGGTNYEEHLRWLTEQEGGRLMVTEFLFDLHYLKGRPLLKLHPQRDPDPFDPPARYLTRLRAVVPANMLDRDVVLESCEPGTLIGNRHRVALGAEPPTRPLVLVAAVGASVVAARVLLPARCWAGRLAGAAALVFALAAVGLM